MPGKSSGLASALGWNSHYRQSSPGKRVEKQFVNQWASDGGMPVLRSQSRRLCRRLHGGHQVVGGATPRSGIARMIMTEGCIVVKESIDAIAMIEG